MGKIMYKGETFSNNFDKTNAIDIAYDNSGSGLTAPNVQAAIDEVKDKSTWKWAGSASGTGKIAIPEGAREVKVKVLIQPTSNAAVIAIDFHYINEFPYVSYENHIGGFYYSASYYASVAIYAQEKQLFLSTDDQWTKVCYNGSIIKIADLWHCSTRVWYK